MAEILLWEKWDDWGGLEHEDREATRPECPGRENRPSETRDRNGELERHACHARRIRMDNQTSCSGRGKRVPPKSGRDKRVPPRREADR